MTTIIVPLYGHLKNGFKRLWSITKLAKKRRLNISMLDEVGANVIALDDVKRKLLFTKSAPGTSSCLIIDLDNLETCILKKEYNSINAGDLKKKKLHQFLKSMFLHLVFKNGTGPVSLRLFDSQNRQQDNVAEIEEKAAKWQTIVSKLLPIAIPKTVQ